MYTECHPSLRLSPESQELVAPSAAVSDDADSSSCHEALQLLLCHWEPCWFSAAVVTGLPASSRHADHAGWCLCVCRCGLCPSGRMTRCRWCAAHSRCDSSSTCRSSTKEQQLQRIGVCLCGACDVSHLTGWFSTSCPTLEVGLPLSWMWTVLACTRRTPYGCQLFAVACEFYMLAVLLGDALSLSQALSAGCTPYGIVHACRACLPCTPGNIVFHSSPGACMHV